MQQTNLHLLTDPTSFEFQFLKALSITLGSTSPSTIGTSSASDVAKDPGRVLTSALSRIRSQSILSLSRSIEDGMVFKLPLSFIFDCEVTLLQVCSYSAYTLPATPKWSLSLLLATACSVSFSPSSAWRALATLSFSDHCMSEHSTSAFNKSPLRETNYAFNAFSWRNPVIAHSSLVRELFSRSPWRFWVR